MKTGLKFAQVVVAGPFWRCFDYVIPEAMEVAIGDRVQVPFGRRDVVGVVVNQKGQTDFPLDKLKTISARLDDEPIITMSVLETLRWASQYYAYPLGDAIFCALPNQAKQTKAMPSWIEDGIIISALGKEQITQGKMRAKKQAALLELIHGAEQGLSASQIKNAGFTSATLNAVKKKGLVTLVKKAGDTASRPVSFKAADFSLSPEQEVAIAAITQQPNFHAFLLKGVTGSGKTEVYLQCLSHCLQQGKQGLVLVPEIALTPQTVQRFAQRFNVDIAVLHSKLTDKERAQSWMRILTGHARIIIGTRSAIFVPMKQPGIIIIDEEHDPSFKQQAGFRYSARDLAMIRAKKEGIPVVLGSATPSLESLHNVEKNRYHLLTLPKRSGASQPVTYRIIDLRDQKLQAGLSDELIEKIREHVLSGKQIILFLNRRGFAPVLMCHHCGFIVNCPRCDAHLIVHSRPKRLCCHHCDYQSKPMSHCAHCKQQTLMTVGQGTEQLEDVVRERFPQVGVTRVDRDTVRSKHHLEQKLHEINSNQSQIIIGTQMLAKGHHFPNVTLVAVVDADTGLFSADFRATEKMAQLLTQVAGRAGRAMHAGEVLIQTHQPDHPMLNLLLQKGYDEFAKAVLHERQQIPWPPFSYIALLRADSPVQIAPFQFLETIKKNGQLDLTQLQVFGPVPAPMEKKAGRFRAQLLVRSRDRRTLQQQLPHLLKVLADTKHKAVRWSVDVDPLDLS